MYFFEKFDFAWSWIGIGASLVLLPILFCTDVFRSDLTKKRFRDIGWLAWLVLPVYMVHQFEEYALHYDWKGQIAPFTNIVCTNTGYAPYPDCPIPMQHYWLVNMGLWLAVLMGASLYRAGKTNAMVALAPYGLVLANGLLHIGGWLVSGNTLTDFRSAGVMTSILLFIPLSVWVIYVCIHEKIMNKKAITLTFLSGLAGHLILFGAYASMAKGGVMALYVFDVVAMGSPLVFAWFASRWVGQG